MNLEVLNFITGIIKVIKGSQTILQCFHSVLVLSFNTLVF